MASTFFKQLQSNLEDAGIELNKEKTNSQIVTAAEKEIPEPGITQLHQRSCTHTDHKDCKSSKIDEEGYENDLPESPRFSI